jgi:hypothetical protein
MGQAYAFDRVREVWLTEQGACHARQARRHLCIAGRAKRRRERCDGGETSFDSQCPSNDPNRLPFTRSRVSFRTNHLEVLCSLSAPLTSTPHHESSSSTSSTVRSIFGDQEHRQTTLRTVCGKLRSSLKPSTAHLQLYISSTIMPRKGSSKVIHYYIQQLHNLSTSTDSETDPWQAHT